MNIFALDDDPGLAAKWACDKHVSKMVLETAQLLSTVSAELGVPAPYRPTHRAHPCALWAGASRGNWEWLVEHGLGLGMEYLRRYGREHKSEEVIRWAALRGGRPIGGARQPFAQAMPEAYQRPDAVEAYRAYYIGEKARIATWKAPAEPPPWWILARPSDGGGNDRADQ